jgi:hypothetical protein
MRAGIEAVYADYTSQQPIARAGERILLPIRALGKLQQRPSARVHVRLRAYL